MAILRRIKDWLRNRQLAFDFPSEYNGHQIYSFLESRIVAVGYEQGRTWGEIELALIVHRASDVPFK